MASQLYLLSHDVNEIRDQIQQRGAKDTCIGRLDKVGDHNLHLVVLELMFRAVDLASGLGAVLEHRRYASSQALLRGLLEASVTLTWIAKHNDPRGTAWEYTAFSRIKLDTAHGVDAPEPNIGQTLADIPAAIVETAKARVEKKNNWSGKPFRQKMEDLSLPYSLYAWTSEELHGRVMGVHAGVEILAEGKATIRLGLELTDEFREDLANAGRIALLQAFHYCSSTLYNEKPQIATENPKNWPPKPVDDGTS